ncbi:unnamed protein product [Closterium sp. Naga37s-1]|nr:unnamed protein product [Closterium sp. Naga37s-1]
MKAGYVRYVKHCPLISTFEAPQNPLHALSGAAKLTITGACGANRTTRRIISGGGAFPIFTSPSSGPTGGLLTLVNLNFQRAAGGVFYNVRTSVNASQCDFVGNTGPIVGGGVLSESFPMAATLQGLPTRLFSRCTFSSNTAPTLGGGAVSINGGNSMGRVPDMRFVRCAFQDNSAPTSLGGAISVVGMGWVRFVKCSFFGNRAGVSGGGVFSSDTYLSFSQATFNNNMALGKYNGGAGGAYVRSGYGCAVYAVSNELVPNMAVRFCSSSFSSNRGFY